MLKDCVKKLRFGLKELRLYWKIYRWWGRQMELIRKTGGEVIEREPTREESNYWLHGILSKYSAYRNKPAWAWVGFYWLKYGGRRWYCVTARDELRARAWVGRQPILSGTIERTYGTEVVTQFGDEPNICLLDLVLEDGKI